MDRSSTDRTEEYLRLRRSGHTQGGVRRATGVSRTWAWVVDRREAERLAAEEKAKAQPEPHVHDATCSHNEPPPPTIESPMPDDSTEPLLHITVPEGGPDQDVTIDGEKRDDDEQMSVHETSTGQEQILSFTPIPPHGPSAGLPDYLERQRVIAVESSPVNHPRFTGGRTSDRRVVLSHSRAPAYASGLRSRMCHVVNASGLTPAGRPSPSDMETEDLPARITSTVTLAVSRYDRSSSLLLEKRLRLR
jgi:hypothetical protein